MGPRSHYRGAVSSSLVPMCPSCQTAEHLQIVAYWPARFQVVELGPDDGAAKEKHLSVEPVVSYRCTVCGYAAGHVVSRDWQPPPGTPEPPT